MPAPTSFFEIELGGEEPLSLATAERLTAAAVLVGARQPWKTLTEEQLIFVSAPGWPEPHTCSIMGMLGEVLSVVVYLGNAGYHFFRRIEEIDGFDRDYFMGAQHSIQVEWVPRRELTKPDREMLAQIGPQFAKSRRVPMFRTTRPGYHPWYVTEPEGRVLAECLAAVEAFFERPRPEGLWDRKGVYPLVSREQTGTWEPPGEVLVAPVPAFIDSTRVARILSTKQPRGGALEIGHFYAPGGIGEKRRRPAYPHVALAADARTGFAFPPQICQPETPTGELLAGALWQALEVNPSLPSEVHVGDALSRSLLAPLAGELGITLRVKPALPALKAVKEALIEHMLGG